jgi:hypothetical protein
MTEPAPRHSLLSIAARWLVGTALDLPAELVARYPELAEARWRHGGLPLRVGGWFLGRPTVAGFTLWRTVWLANGEPGVPLDAELLLHELRHVHQFVGDRAFPFRYVWRGLRHGYANNPYETDARAFAARRLSGPTPTE